MNNFKYNFTLLCTLCTTLVFQSVSFAKDSLSQKKGMQEIKGIYHVKSIHNKEDYSVIWFESENKHEKAKNFYIELSQQQAALVSAKQIVKIYASVKKESNPLQAFKIFIKTQGQNKHARFWLLSRKSQHSQLTKLPKLEMHGTHNDFFVF